MVRRHSLRYGYTNQPFGSECPNILHNYTSRSSEISSLSSSILSASSTTAREAGAAAAAARCSFLVEASTPPTSSPAGRGISSGFRPARNASITGVGASSGSVAFKAAMVAFADWSSVSSSLARAVACLSRNSSSQVNSSNLSESTARPAPSRNEAASKEDWVGAGPRDRSPLAWAGRATGAAAAEAVS